MSAGAADLLYWEDLEPELEMALGQYYLSQAELIEFARRYDPQPFHVDPERARVSAIGCLCASGTHTLAITQRLVFDRLYSRCAVVAGLGIDRVRLHRPVLPDENLSGRVQVVSRERHRLNSNRGIVVLGIETTNPRSQKVASMHTTILALKRTAR